ncbi:hypothetical protein MBANPS3_011865 [Mucor bainieri]
MHKHESSCQACFDYVVNAGAAFGAMDAIQQAGRAGRASQVGYCTTFTNEDDLANVGLLPEEAHLESEVSSQTAQDQFKLYADALLDANICRRHSFNKVVDSIPVSKQPERIPFEYPCYVCGIVPPKQGRKVKAGDTILHFKNAHSYIVTPRPQGEERPAEENIEFVINPKGRNQFDSYHSACPSCWFHCPSDANALQTLATHMTRNNHLAHGNRRNLRQPFIDEAGVPNIIRSNILPEQVPMEECILRRLYRLRGIYDNTANQGRAHTTSCTI